MAVTLDTALVTAADFKTFRKLSGSGDDTLIALLVSQVSAAVSAWCGRKFAQATYTNEVYDGTGTGALYLRNWPVTSPMASGHGVWVDQTHQWTTALVEHKLDGTTSSGDYVVADGEDGQGLLSRIGSTWPKVRRCIRVTYQGGYATVPAPVQSAAMRLLAIAYDVTVKGLHAVSSESVEVGGGSRTVITREMPDDVRRMLTPFRRVVW